MAVIGWLRLMQVLDLFVDQQELYKCPGPDGLVTDVAMLLQHQTPGCIYPEEGIS